MDMTEIVKHLRDEAKSHLQQAGDLVSQSQDHVRQAAELELHARQIEATADSLPSAAEIPAGPAA